MDMEKVAEPKRTAIFLSLSHSPPHLLLRHVPLWKPISADISSDFLLGNRFSFSRIDQTYSLETENSLGRAEIKIAIEWFFFVICCCARLGVFASIMWLWSDWSDVARPASSMNLCFALPLFSLLRSLSLWLMRARQICFSRKRFRCNQLELENYQKTGPFFTVCYLPQRFIFSWNESEIVLRSRNFQCWGCSIL